MDTNSIQNTQNQTQINLNQGIPVIYTDSIFITVNQFGVMLDVAQTTAATNQQTVVARLGMSKEHAKALIESLKKRLEEAEKLDKNINK